MASKEEIQELGKSIENSVQNSIQAGVQAVILPPDTKKLIAEISQSFDSQDIKKIEMALVKLEKITTQLGVNLSEHNKNLGDTFAKYSQEKTTADAKIAELKEKGIVAETRIVEKNGEQVIEAMILSKSEIKERRKLVNKEFIQLEKDEKNYKKELTIAKKSDITAEQSAELIKKQDDLTDRRNELTKTQENLTDTEKAQKGGDEGMHGLPDFIAGPLQTMGEFLMTPIRMFQALSEQIGGVIKGFVQLGKFIFGNLIKAGKKLILAFKGLTMGAIISTMALMAKFLLFGVVIAAGILFFTKTILPVWKWIGGWLWKVLKPVLIPIGKGLRFLWEGLKSLVDWFRNSWLGKKLKLDDESRAEKAVEKEEEDLAALQSKENLTTQEQTEYEELKKNQRDRQLEKGKEKIEEDFVSRDPETGRIDPVESMKKFMSKGGQLLEREKDVEQIKREGAQLTTPITAPGVGGIMLPQTNINTRQGDVFTLPNIIKNQEESFNRAAGYDV